MADQIRTNGSAIRRTAFKWVSLALIGSSLLYLVHISTQPSVQDSIARRRQTVLAFFYSWLKTCHERAAQPLIWRYIPWVQKLDAVHLRPSCLPTCSVEHKKSLCGCLVPRATEIDYSTIGYSQPSFPFNVLPGRVETTCQNFSGYALERCQIDVRTRTELFIALVAVFSLVVFCIILITILTCMRRIKARRRVGPASLARKKSKQAGKTFIPGRRKRDNGYLGDISHGQSLTSPQSLNEDEAVEAEEQGIADQDIPVTLDGMTDGWMQWIRQRANMQQLSRKPSTRQVPDILSPPDPLAPGLPPALRIPSLKLPKPTLSTFRKTGGLGSASTRPSNQSVNGTGNKNGKGKEKLRVRWHGSV